MFRAFADTLQGVPRSGPVFANGTDMETATQIDTDICRITDGEGGVKLPPAVAGVGCAVVNKTEAIVFVYPDNMLGRINALPLGEAFKVEALSASFFLCYEDGLWVSFAQALPVPPPEPPPVEEPAGEPVEEPVP